MHLVSFKGFGVVSLGFQEVSLSSNTFCRIYFPLVLLVGLAWPSGRIAQSGMTCVSI